MNFIIPFLNIIIITISPLLLFKLIFKNIPFNTNNSITILFINIILSLILCYFFDFNMVFATITIVSLNILNYNNVKSSNFNIKSFRPIALFLLVLFLYYFIPTLPFLFIEEKASEVTQALAAVIGNYILLIILILIYIKDIKPYIKNFVINYKTYIDIGFHSWSIGLSIMFISNIIIGLLFKQTGANNEEIIQQMINITPFLSLIATSFQAPIIEEIVFRKTIKDMFDNKKLFILISGFIFGLLHVVFSFNNFIDFLYIIPYGALGISFAYMYSKTNNLCVPILFHFIHNFALTIISIILWG